MNKLAVIVVAAGTGTRMQTAISKQYLMLEDKPILAHTLERFEQITEVSEIVLVVGAAEVDAIREWKSIYQLSKLRQVVAGAGERQHSVACGLKALSADIAWVMIHDGVRPLIKSEHVFALWLEVQRAEAAVLAVPVKDTVKLVSADRTIESTPDRAAVWAIQTPQAFRRSLLERAYEAAARDGFLGTDDAMLVERVGVPVKVVAGDYSNLKITTPEDLALAEVLLRRERE